MAAESGVKSGVKSDAGLGANLGTSLGSSVGTSPTGVAEVLQVAFEQIEATAVTALAEVPTRLQRAMRSASTPHERVQLAAARRHMLEQRMHLARSFGLALRGRALRNPLSAAVIARAMDHAIGSLTPDAAVAKLLSRHANPTMADAMKGCQERIVQALAAQRADPLRQPAVAALPERDRATVRQQAELLDALMRGDPDAHPVAHDPFAFFAEDNDGPLTQVVRDLVGKPVAAVSSATAESAPNLVRAHRAALEQAAKGPKDRLLIGIVVDLIDAVVADKQVPLPVAAMLSRLQLPMLRVALRDPGFFASNAHPMRRFVDRVATLGSARDDLDSAAGSAWLQRVEALVQQIAQGEFQQNALYEQKLLELEQVTAEQARAEVEASPAAAALHGKEAQWQQLSRQSARLRDDLTVLPLPGFVQDFLARVWVQVAATSQQPGATETEASRRWHRAAVALATSVLPKRSADERNRFVDSLRGLMAELGAGLDQIGWPPAERRAFFDQLMAAHATSLRAAPLADADHAALQWRLGQVLGRPAEPAVQTASPDAVRDAPPDERAVPTLLAPHLEQHFSPEEALRVGLLSEADVGPAEPDSAPERSPCAQFQVGLSYRLLLQAQWQAIRLSYMSPGRNFFMFTHGSKQRHSISMTARMVDRLHAGARFVVAETAPLLDRATAQMRSRSSA